MKLLFIMAIVALVSGAQPVRAVPSYVDDRSTPQTLIQSLYNAINRKEYARAYAYFDTPPAETVEVYAEGFADTISVEVLTGIPGGDGAAGTFHYSIPVAIRSRDVEGEDHVFAGCYDLIFVSPGPQTTPYKPLVIDKGTLSPAEGSLDEVLPESCGDGRVDVEETLRERARRAFETNYGSTCPAARAEDGQDPDSHMVQFNYSYDEEGAPQREAWLFRFLCQQGAYNQIHVFYLALEGRAPEPLQFVVPDLNIRYENDNPEGAVSEVRVVGYSTHDQLVNAQFNPDALTISSDAKWRGVGDASSTALWLFRSGDFTLVRYDVDASYDGEVNPQTIIDFFTGP